MNSVDHRESKCRGTFRNRSPWALFLLGGCLLVILMALFLPRRRDPSVDHSGSATDALGQARVADAPSVERLRRPPPRLTVAPVLTAEEVVTNKLSQFARDRRAIVHAMARHFKIEVPAEVERYFDAAEAGRFDELDSLYKAMNASRQTEGRCEGLAKLWPAILETCVVAEAVRDWPAQKLLDYGQAVLGSLRPGTIYVGGTDPGRGIPTFLNETSDGERHIVLTQNGLVDGSYLEYVRFLYGDRLAPLMPKDSERAFQEYIDDAQKRLQHDHQFPNEPKQVRPGEDISVTDGRVQVSGIAAVMGINEKLLQTLMAKNPDAVFALEESFPLRSIYTNAVPVGPIMELRVQAKDSAFDTERAAQALDYWRATSQQLLADPEAAGSKETLMAYSKMATAQANLLANHNYNAEAEQAYCIASTLWPAMPEAASGLADLLARAGRTDEARRLLEDFARSHPDQRDNVEFSGTWKLVVTPSAGLPPARPKNHNNLFQPR